VSSGDYGVDLRRFRHSRVGALKLTLGLVLGGALWMVLWRAALAHWVTDAQLAAQLDTAKGWIFLGVAGVVVYFSAAHHLGIVQRSEAMQRALIEDLNDGVLLVGPAGTIVGVNAATVRMLGLSHRKSLIGMSGPEFAELFRLLRSDGSVIPMEDYATVRALRGEVVDTYKALVHRQGGKPPLPITVTAAPVRATPDGPVELSVTVLRDVEALERLESMRDEFFSAAAHALKTPVTTISLHAQLLAAGPDAEPLHKTARVLVRQCCRIEWLVRNLLVASRLRHGGLTFHMEGLDLAELARGAAKEVRAREPLLALQLEIEAHPNVFADRERLELVLGNLVTQAYLAAPSAEPVRLRLTALDHRVRLAVTTPRPAHGAPISADGPAEVIRARFDRVLDAGVALYVSEGIVNAHGGQLERSLGPEDARLTWFDLPILARDREANL
jgi:PAS domain S-box-containing protein